MSKFKVGDRVVSTVTNECVNKGDKGTVIEDYVVPRVNWDGHHKNWYIDERFLILEKQEELQ